MAAKARKKYIPKNIGEYRRLRHCTHKEGCDEYGIVSYRNDPLSGSVKVEFRCIEHVHKEREKQPSKEGGWKPMRDISLLLAINHADVR